MLKVEKLINLRGDEIFYLATEIGAIEVSIRNGCDIYWNFIGLNYDRYSKDEVTLCIKEEDHQGVYYIFENLFEGIISLNDKVKNGLLSQCFMGEDALSVITDQSIVWQSDDALLNNANCLIISKNEDCYLVTFRKSKNMDGYLNRSYRVKIKNIGCRNAPLNLAFMDFYKELLKMTDIDKKEQKAYTLLKKSDNSLVAQ